MLERLHAPRGCDPEEGRGSPARLSFDGHRGEVRLRPQAPGAARARSLQLWHPARSSAAAGASSNATSLQRTRSVADAQRGTPATRVVDDDHQGVARELSRAARAWRISSPKYPISLGSLRVSRPLRVRNSRKRAREWPEKNKRSVAHSGSRAAERRK